MGGPPPPIEIEEPDRQTPAIITQEGEVDGWGRGGLGASRTRFVLASFNL
jgi:hypothetical protein